MRKFTLIIAAVLFATTAMAQARHATKTTTLAQTAQHLYGNKLAKAPAKAGEEPIFDVPEGTVYENLYATSDAMGLGFGGFYYQDVDGGIGGVVEGSDGCLYIYAPISQTYIWFTQLPWLKAEKNADGNYVLKTPQVYAYDAGDPYYAYRMKWVEDEQKCFVDEENTDIVFSWNDGVLTQLDDCYIGLGDADGEWFYMADKNIVYRPQTDQTVSAPEGLSPDNYLLTYRSSAKNESATKERMVNVIIDGSDIYLGNINDNTPDSYIKGNIDNGKAVFASKQYIGPDAYYGGHAYVLTGNAFIDGEEDSPFFNYNLTDNIIFDVDDEGKTLTATYPASMITNIGPNNLYIISDYVAPKLTYVEDKAATPANPIFTADDLMKFNENSGMGKMSFEIVLKDTEGGKLNENKVLYNIYLDDQPLTFTPDVYTGLTEEMTDVPYKFQDTSNYDIYIYGGKHTVYYYTNDFSKIGVQTIYRAGGEEHRSDIVYVDVAELGINNITGEKNANKWYNLNGLEVQKPAQKGIYIHNGKKYVVK